MPSCLIPSPNVLISPSACTRKVSIFAGAWLDRTYNLAGREGCHVHTSSPLPDPSMVLIDVRKHSQCPSRATHHHPGLAKVLSESRRQTLRLMTGQSRDESLRHDVALNELLSADGRRAGGWGWIHETPTTSAAACVTTGAAFRHRCRRPCRRRCNRRHRRWGG